MGLLKPDRGEVYFDGQRIDTMNERQLNKVRPHFGFLFQMGALFDSETVDENVAFPLVEHTSKSPEEIARIVKEKLTMVGLARRRVQNARGTLRRTAQARRPGPRHRTGAGGHPLRRADHRARPRSIGCYQRTDLKLQRQLRVTSVVVTHDMHSAFKVADRIVMLHEGKLIFDGTPEKMRASQDPVIRRFISGEAGEQELQGLTLFDKEEPQTT